MEIFNGKKESEKIFDKLSAKIKIGNLKPHLVVFLVGDNKASEMYVNLKKHFARKIGVKFNLYTYDENTNENEVILKIKEVNEDESISGMIVQMPLPIGFNSEKIVSSISPTKDMDGFHKENTKALKNGKKMKVSPVLPGVILHALKTARRVKPKREKIKALVNSRIFGNVLKAFFMANGLELEFFIAKRASLKKIKEFTGDADVLISVLGRRGIINGEMIKQGVILVDAGITKKDGKVYGDFDFESCANKAEFITPVPGGIGPMTIAFLFKNVVSFELQRTKHSNTINCK